MVKIHWLPLTCLWLGCAWSLLVMVLLIFRVLELEEPDTEPAQVLSPVETEVPCEEP